MRRVHRHQETAIRSLRPGRQAHIQSEQHYDSLYRQSIEEPEAFWDRQAREQLTWIAPWQSVLRHDFSVIGQADKPYVSWFEGGQLNVSVNCLDRHVHNGRGDHVALIWQGDDERQEQTFTYQQLLREVSRFANVLKKYGVQRGDVVTIYLPMIPQAVIAMLACTRIGAVHSVVFSAFSAQALAQRINDAQAKLVVTADVGFYGGKIIPLKQKVDTALEQCPSVSRVIVYQRSQEQVSVLPPRDVSWDKAMAGTDISDDCPPAPMQSEAPLFILYTSGSTGKPKAIQHTTAGYLLQAHLTFRWLFNVHPDDVHYCTADIGWITGHSYVVYGPLSNGITSVIFEGTPTYPEPNRFWKIIEQHKATIFYTAPTAIRTLMQFGDTWPEQHNLSSLRVLGSVGEPINEAAWRWFWQTIGHQRCPVLDTWWQTETGAIMIAPFAGATPLKPGSATKPFFGVRLAVLRPDGTPTKVNEAGSLVITHPWPSMLRGIHGDREHRLLHQTYFSQFPGYYCTGDGCRRDEEGFYWLLGRIDDVMNVSAHRFSSAEIEQALTSHPAVMEAAAIGIPDTIKGEAICCFVTTKKVSLDQVELRKILTEHLRTIIGPIATPAAIYQVPALPKTRSGKIMRRILRAIVTKHPDHIGDTTTLADPPVVEVLTNAIAAQQ